MPDRGTVLGALSRAFRRKRTVDLVVGLDFGTSSTKVAFRELGAATRRVTPLTFDHGLATYPAFCLPSVGAVTPDRRFVWGPEAVRALQRGSWSAGIRRLKVLLAGEHEAAFRDERTTKAFEKYLSETGLSTPLYKPEYLASVALAKQMHLIRGLLIKRYRGADLDIRFNVCVPIDHLEHSRMIGVYHKINHVAEEIYRSWVPDGWDDTALIEVAAAKFDGASPTPRPDGRVFAMPEAMAEIAGYLVSLETREGIHAVLDIGSGTTDLSIFSLRGPDAHERDCYWYAARNVPRGTGYVEAAVAGLLRAANKEPTVVTEAAVFEALSRAVPAKEVRNAVYHELEAIWKALRATWVEAYGRHYKRQSGWESIPLFICGGGASLADVNTIFARAWVPNFKDFTVRGLPVPDDYDSLHGAVPFSRLSVAYGLTFLGPELGGFSLPADSPDHTPVLSVKDLPMPWTDGAPG